MKGRQSRRATMCFVAFVLGVGCLDAAEARAFERPSNRYRTEDPLQISSFKMLPARMCGSPTTAAESSCSISGRRPAEDVFGRTQSVEASRPAEMHVGRYNPRTLT